MAKNNMMGVWIVIAVLVVGFLFLNGTLSIDQAADEGADDGAATGDCNVEDVALKYNDLDAYKIGTDPSSVLYIIGGDVTPQSLADDGSLTVPTNAEMTAIAGEDSTTYFSEEVTVNTECKDPAYVSVELTKAGAPTVTVINDDGTTKNANSTAGREDIAADNSYIAEFTVRSSADTCASKYGAVVACEYDATYIQDIEAESVVTDATEAIYLTHGSNAAHGGGTTATFDQWATFEYADELCDGKKDTFSLKYTTTSTTPEMNTGMMNCTWLPKDIDKNEDDFSVIGPAIYDEDNNLIAIGTVSFAHYNT